MTIRKGSKAQRVGPTGRTKLDRYRSILSRQRHSIHVSESERLLAVQDVLMDLTQAECPCGECMGVGCTSCSNTGADLDSLMAIRRAVAKALEIMEKSKPLSTKAIAKELAGGARKGR